MHVSTSVKLENFSIGLVWGGGDEAAKYGIQDLKDDKGGRGESCDSHKHNKMWYNFNLKTFPVSERKYLTLCAIAKRFGSAIRARAKTFEGERTRTENQIYASVTMSHSMKHRTKISQIAVKHKFAAAFAFFALPALK